MCLCLRTLVLCDSVSSMINFISFIEPLVHRVVFLIRSIGSFSSMH